MKKQTLLSAIFILLFPMLTFAGYWDADIKRFEDQDQKYGFLTQSNLFIGSSSIRFFQTQKHFPNKDTINRGFGGSQVSDVLHYYDRIVKKYSPKVVVLYSGDNDLHAGKSVQQVFNDFKTLITKLKQDSDPKIFWLLTKKSLARQAMQDKVDQLNDLVEAEYGADSKIKLFDLNDFFKLPHQGRQYLQSDLLHFNEKAYTLLSNEIRSFLK